MDNEQTEQDATYCTRVMYDVLKMFLDPPTSSEPPFFYEPPLLFADNAIAIKRWLDDKSGRRISFPPGFAPDTRYCPPHEDNIVLQCIEALLSRFTIVGRAIDGFPNPNRAPIDYLNESGQRLFTRLKNEYE